MTRHRNLLVAAVIAVAACSANGSNVLLPDPTLSLPAAHSRWTALGAHNYTFDVVAVTAMLPSIGFVRVEVAGGQVTSARLVKDGSPVPIAQVFTIDELWSRILSASSRDDMPVDVQFSRNGVPVNAMIGSFANDSGVRYEIRTFVLR